MSNNTHPGILIHSLLSGHGYDISKLDDERPSWTMGRRTFEIQGIRIWRQSYLIFFFFSFSFGESFQFRQFPTAPSEMTKLIVQEPRIVLYFVSLPLTPFSSYERSAGRQYVLSGSNTTPVFTNE